MKKKSKLFELAEKFLLDQGFRFICSSSDCSSYDSIELSGVVDLFFEDEFRASFYRAHISKLDSFRGSDRFPAFLETITQAAIDSDVQQLKDMGLADCAEKMANIAKASLKAQKILPGGPAPKDECVDQKTCISPTAQARQILYGYGFELDYNTCGYEGYVSKCEGIEAEICPGGSKWLVRIFENDDEIWFTNKQLEILDCYLRSNLSLWSNHSNDNNKNQNMSCEKFNPCLGSLSEGPCYVGQIENQSLKIKNDNMREVTLVTAVYDPKMVDPTFDGEPMVLFVHEAIFHTSKKDRYFKAVEKAKAAVETTSSPSKELAVFNVDALVLKAPAMTTLRAEF